MAEDVSVRLAELDELLKVGVRDRPVITFASLKRNDTYLAFDAGPLGRAKLPPLWQEFAPAPPSGLGKILGGGGRFEKQLDTARGAYARAVEQHAAAEADRLRQLAEQRAAYDAAAAAFAASVAEHNAGIVQFQRDCRAGDPEAVAEFCTLVLDSSVYPEGFPHQTRTVYRPDPKEAVIEWELPPQSVIPLDRDFRYVASRDAIDALPRAEKEIKERYRTVIAQVALRTMHEILVSTSGSVIDLVTFYGYVSMKDPATGQPIRPLLLQVSAQREVFSTFLLSDLDPVACLKRLNALVSPHPYDLEPVKPTVDFDSLLTRFKFVAGMDVIAGLDSRPDLLVMAPYEFEHLVRQIFEESLEHGGDQGRRGGCRRGKQQCRVRRHVYHPGQALPWRRRRRGRPRAGWRHGRQARDQGRTRHHVLGHQGRPCLRDPSRPHRDHGMRARQVPLHGAPGPGRPDQPPQASPALTSISDRRRPGPGTGYPVN